MVYIMSTVPIIVYNSGFGKREARRSKSAHGGTIPEKAAPVSGTTLRTITGPMPADSW